MKNPAEERPTVLRPWQAKLHEVIFEADTRSGKIFDVTLLIAILLSVVAVMLDSTAAIRAAYGFELYVVEWIFTIFFTIEYILRLVSVARPLAYAGSFFGIIDLLAIIPTYLSLVVPSAQYLLVIRILRVLRVFRIFKLVQYLRDASILFKALISSVRKIIVFLIAVLAIVVIFGSIMYLIEGPENGFESIPQSIYWAIVTLTTVGYGDIAPQTSLGRFISALVMILGYALIAVPTGIVSVEMSRASHAGATTQACPNCSKEGHDEDATHCKYCGQQL